jgi:LAO/AO transport system kinase
MKAGILEWPDIFFVNKSDLSDLAARTAAELRAGLDLGRSEAPAQSPPVLCGSARDGVGIDALLEAMDSHHDAIASSGEEKVRRAAGRLARVRSALATRYGSFGLARLAEGVSISEFVASHPESSVERMIETLGAQIETRFGTTGR